MSAPDSAGTGPGGTAGVRILYGSEMGNAEYLADDLAQALSERSISSSVAELDRQPIEELHAAGIALIIVSTYGEGEMPYGADAFWEQLDRDDAPSCAGLRYAVLALGDSSYTYFCEAGISIDDRLEQLGATRIAERVDCDSNYRDAARAWIEARVAQLEALVPRSTPAAGVGDSAQDPDRDDDDEWDPDDWSLGDEDSGAESSSSAPAFEAFAPPPSPWTRENPFAARLTRAVRLTGDASEKEVMHYELDLAGSGMSLQPGDSLGVIPENDDFAVEHFLEAARVHGWRPFHGRSFRSLARERWELRFPTAALLAEIGARAPESELGALVTASDRAGVDEWVRGHNVIEALRALPEPIPAGRLGELMGPIRYRAYSVASSQLAHPEAVHLTVATSRLSESVGMRTGVASGYLSDRVGVGNTVHVFPLPNRTFRLPVDAEAPIIMIGPGVGIAPFRAFLQERERTGATGPAWLFFGNRTERSDYLYRSDWEGFHARGALTRLDTAFSRDQAMRVHVQARMREHGEQLASWLRDGAYLYLCGDARRMAPDVERELAAILIDHLGEAEGRALTSRLREEKRLRSDVY